MMGVMNQIASALGKKDDVPNIALAETLSDSGDRDGVRELVRGLSEPDSSVQSDCIKVLYEIGYRNPALIAEHALDFLALLSSRNNRLVWGGMIALSAIAPLKADVLFRHLDSIQKAIEAGSVIPTDAGMKALSNVAATNAEFHRRIFPYLLEKLRSCRAKSVPMYAESVVVAVWAEDRSDFLKALEKRRVELSPSQDRRVRKILEMLDPSKRSNG